MIKLYCGSTKLKFLQKNSAELTEFFLTLDITFLRKLGVQFTTAFLNRTFYVVQQNGAIPLEKNIMKIFILQKRGKMLITFSEFQEHTTPIFKNLKILKYKINKTLLSSIL